MNKKIFWFREAAYEALDGKAGVREVYERMADRYDCSEYLYWTRRIEEGEGRAVERWIMNLSSPVLDVGCGTGRYTVKIADNGSKVVALDISRRMLKKTVEKASERGCRRMVNPVLADGEHLPFRQRSFNALICTLTFDHFENAESAAGEFSRTLKRWGTLILSTFNSFTLSDFKRRYNLPLDKVPFRTEDTLPTLVYEVGHSVDELRRMFGEQGFRMLDVKGCCYWHVFPSFLIGNYSVKLDPFFNAFKSLLKHAEIHAVRMEKTVD